MQEGGGGGGGGGARTLELCMDDARFSAKEHCIAIAFGNGWTAYPPPQVLRELAWKANPDDSGLSAVDQERCRKKGLRGIDMMRSFDMLRCVDRLAKMSAGWGLEAIRLCVPLLPVQPGQVRFWSKKKASWLRKDMALESVEPELACPLRVLSSQRVLLLCMDQASTNNAVANFLQHPKGYNGLVLVTEDPFHRAYNDWKFAVRHACGGFEHAVLQMTVVYKLPYGPWLHAANLSARREAMEELLRKPEVARIFSALGLSNMAKDARRLVPADESEAIELLLERLEDSSVLRKKGPYVKHMRFFSYLEAAAFYDEDRTAWIALTHWLAQAIYGEDAISDTVRDKVAASLYEAGGGASGEDAATARERLQEIRKRIGNSMQLAPLLMTRENMVNDRVSLLVSKQIWKEHGALSRSKLNPASNLERAVSLAQDVGLSVIRKTWCDAFSSSAELARLGIVVDACSLNAGLASRPGVLVVAVVR